MDMRPSLHWLSGLVSLLALATAACISDGVPGEGQSVAFAGDAPEVRPIDLDLSAVSPEEACDAFYDAAAELAERCGYDGAAVRRLYTSSLPHGDCRAVTEVDGLRDLYRRCLPDLAELACDTWLASGFSEAGCDEVLLTYDESSPSASQACRDVANAYGALAAICGGDYAEFRDAFVQAIPCSSVFDIRDRTALYERCIPAIIGASCDRLEAGFDDGACQAQLLTP